MILYYCFLLLCNVNRVDWENIVCEKMAERKDWWLALHLTSFHATKDSKENPELFEVKASLTKILFPGWFVFILVELILKMMS